jgi:F0F1-type ATP synthase membrane subunit c/vacuolar-type H+-ATPase subunit K
MTHRSLASTSEPWVPKKPSPGLWLAVGAGIGVAVGAAIDSLAMSLAVGATLGAVLDFFTRKK